MSQYMTKRSRAWLNLGYGMCCMGQMVPKRRRQHRRGVWHVLRLGPKAQRRWRFGPCLVQSLLLWLTCVSAAVSHFFIKASAKTFQENESNKNLFWLKYENILFFLLVRHFIVWISTYIYYQIHFFSEFHIFTINMKSPFQFFKEIVKQFQIPFISFRPLTLFWGGTSHDRTVESRKWMKYIHPVVQ